MIIQRLEPLEFTGALSAFSLREHLLTQRISELELSLAQALSSVSTLQDASHEQKALLARQSRTLVGAFDNKHAVQLLLDRSSAELENAKLRLTHPCSCGMAGQVERLGGRIARQAQDIQMLRQASYAQKEEEQLLMRKLASLQQRRQVPEQQAAAKARQRPSPEKNIPAALDSPVVEKEDYTAGMDSGEASTSKSAAVVVEAARSQVLRRGRNGTITMSPQGILKLTASLRAKGTRIRPVEESSVPIEAAAHGGVRSCVSLAECCRAAQQAALQHESLLGEGACNASGQICTSDVTLCAPDCLPDAAYPKTPDASQRMQAPIF